MQRNFHFTTLAPARALALGLLACSGSHPLAAVGAPYAPFDPPALYQAWWDQVQVCAQRTGVFTRIEWQRVEDGPDGTFPCGRRLCAGAWKPPHEIYVARTYLGSEALVKHEMVHDLIQSGNHLDQAFFSCGLQSIEH